MKISPITPEEEGAARLSRKVICRECGSLVEVNNFDFRSNADYVEECFMVAMHRPPSFVTPWGFALAPSSSTLINKPGPCNGSNAILARKR